MGGEHRAAQLRLLVGGVGERGVLAFHRGASALEATTENAGDIRLRR
ncbi:hypothetical protein P4132_05165 [Pseudomonas aeruginosa]|nr:hypothetical protein [Pseudomonas aeruginosa]